MPALFVGHGSPLNAVEENEFVAGWRDAANAMPVPDAILCISAHWETRGTLVTAMEMPDTIHDFGGFPRELYEIRYPAPGRPALAYEIRRRSRWCPKGHTCQGGGYRICNADPHAVLRRMTLIYTGW